MREEIRKQIQKDFEEIFGGKDFSDGIIENGISDEMLEKLMSRSEDEVSAGLERCSDPKIEEWIASLEND